MKNAVGIVHSFCRACGLRLCFEHHLSVGLVMTMTDICGNEAILYEAAPHEGGDFALSKYERDHGNFIGRSHEEICKSFLEAFLLDGVHLFASDGETFEVAEDLKSFARDSLERLVVKLDLLEAQ